MQVNLALSVDVLSLGLVVLPFLMKFNNKKETCMKNLSVITYITYSLAGTANLGGNKPSVPSG